MSLFRTQKLLLVRFPHFLLSALLMITLPYCGITLPYCAIMVGYLHQEKISIKT